MTQTITAKDLSPLRDLSSDDAEWLGQVQRHVASSDHVLRFGDAEASDDGEDFIVSRDAFGRWWTGRYVGDLSFCGRRLEIRPRLGDGVIEHWLGEALNLVAIPESAAQEQSDSFMARLMGAVWCRAVDQASRHGPPSFRRAHPHRGLYVRGRLDVRATARLHAQGSPDVASTQSYRDLDNDVSRTLVAAERALTGRIGHRRWHTPRVTDLLPPLHATVGTRPPLPSRLALRRIRYTPITRPFKAAAELSWRLAHLQGYTASRSDGRSEGLLLDVAELWELFVLRCVEHALPELRVEHGTRTGGTTWLLESTQDPRLGLGRLRPDILASAGSIAHLIADAKYKRIENAWPERPQGVDRGDLYQLTSYLARFSPAGHAMGMLVYPDDAPRAASTALSRGPWRLPNGGNVQFVALNVQREQAIVQLTELVHA